jgi:thiol-disulfide isomerase/thioredoxin
MNDEPSQPETLSVSEDLRFSTRRRNVLVTAGLAATGAGVGLAWWQSQGQVSRSVEPVDGFWALQWDRPEGGVLMAQSWKGKPVLINFWATWCPPCVEELPLINNFFLENKANDWQVVGLAVDKVSAVRTFLQRLPLDFPVGMAGLSGTDLGRQLGNLTGGLPFTAVLDRSGAVVQRKLGRVSLDDLRTWSALK